MKLLQTAFLTLLLTTFFISCKKEFSYEGGIINAGGTWQFQNNGSQYNGNIDSAVIQNIGGTKLLTLTGKSLSGQETFRIRLNTADSFTTTTYLASLYQADFDYSSSSKTIFQGDFIAGEFTVTITSLANNIISGTFSGQAEDSTGAQTQILLGTFTSSIDLSNNGSVQIGTPSTGTLGANPDTCTPIILSGTFKQGVPFTAANTLQIEVNVASLGTFNITTNSVNGVNFSKVGTFTATGVQNITLNGNGTPQAEGVEDFIVTYGSSHCTFPVTFAPADPPATGTLGGAGGACTSITQAGTYAQGLVLSSSNTVTVQVTVSTVGLYTITTNTTNGVTFSGSGTFTATGAQSVILTGSGTPTNAGIQNFAVTFGTSTCNFSLTFEAPPPPAAGTLGGAGGACTPVTPAGTYTQGAALSASNTITIQANITTAGLYTITTNTVNGVTFSGSGNFTATGVQNVVLTGSGTPTAAGVQNFAVTFGTSTCDFPITFAGGIPSVFHCKIDGVLTDFSDQAAAEVVDGITGEPDLYLDGTNPSNASNEFQIFINNNDATAVKAGTYDEKHLIVFPGGYRIEIDYSEENPDMSLTRWNTASNFLPPPNPPFTVIVTSISATRVKGTFSGTLTNPFEGSTAFKVITEGVFDLPIP